MAGTPPNAGAKSWEDAMQSGIPRPAQPAIPNIIGSPEGVLYGDVGAMVTDDEGGLWVKSTDASVATGWKTATLT